MDDKVGYWVLRKTKYEILEIYAKEERESMMFISTISTLDMPDNVYIIYRSKDKTAFDEFEKKISKNI